MNMLVSASAIFAATPAGRSEGVDTNSDAELIALGRQFEAGWAELLPVEARYNSSVDDDMIDAEYDAMHERVSVVVDKIQATPANTFAGLTVKARAVSWCWGGRQVIIGEGQTTDVRLAQSIIDDLLRSAGATPLQPSLPDPVLAAIEAHRAANLCFAKSGTVETDGDLDEALGDAEREAAWSLVCTQPITLAGVAALLTYARELDDVGDAGFRDREFVTALNASIEAAVCEIGGLPTPPDPKLFERAEAA